MARLPQILIWINDLKHWTSSFWFRKLTNLLRLLFRDLNLLGVAASREGKMWLYCDLSTPSTLEHWERWDRVSGLEPPSDQWDGVHLWKYGLIFFLRFAFCIHRAFADYQSPSNKCHAVGGTPPLHVGRRWCDVACFKLVEQLLIVEQLLAVEQFSGVTYGSATPA